MNVRSIPWLCCTTLFFVPAGASPVADIGAPTNLPAVAAFVLQRPLFNALDCEGDGTIEAGEVDEHFAQAYFLLDRDRSRTVSRGEYARAEEADLRGMQERIFELIDTDGNGRISASEYRYHLYQMIESADTNGDGEVTLGEVSALRVTPAQANE